MLAVVKSASAYRISYPMKQEYLLSKAKLTGSINTGLMNQINYPMVNTLVKRIA